MSAFSDAVKRRRAAIGFASAWGFYRAHGPRLLGCTYKAYLYVEGGRSLPQPALAMRVVTALRAGEDPAAARELAVAYVETLAGRPELAEFLVRNLSRAPEARGYAGLFERATRMSFADKSVALTRRQAARISGGFESYWCWLLLSDDRGRWSPAELAKILGSPQARVRAALKGLAAERLIAQDDDGRWYCPEAGKMFNFPRDRWHVPYALEALRRIWSEAARRKGEVLFDRWFLTRASEGDLRGFLPRLAQTADATRVYSVWEKGPDTAFVSVRAVVRKVMPF